MAVTGGDRMTHFMFLLCLGLDVRGGTPEKVGPLPRPTLRVEPANVVANGSYVTLWCEGTWVAQRYFLSTGTWKIQMSLEAGNRAKHHIDHMGPDMANRYTCEQCGDSACATSSDILDLVVTGLYRKPSLTATMRFSETLGEAMMLKCSSAQRFQGFFLNQEREHVFFQESQPHPNGQFYAIFTLTPMTSRIKRTYCCYGYFENPLVRSYSSDLIELVYTDDSERPSLLSPQGSIMTPGQNLILHCRSELDYETFALSKEGSQGLLQSPGYHLQAGLSQANFSLGPVSVYDMGQYRCYGGQGIKPLWSDPSDPLDVLLAGQLRHTPDLLVLPGPLVSPGDNVTLTCVSGGWLDTFLLAKEGVADPPLRVKVDKTEEETTRAQFSFSPVTSAHSGTYRCYSSHSSRPYQLSQPSARLKLWVSGILPAKFLPISFSPVTSAHSGTYRCYSSHSSRPYQLSQPSARLKLWVSGILPAKFLPIEWPPSSPFFTTPVISEPTPIGTQEKPSEIRAPTSSKHVLTLSSVLSTLGFLVTLQPPLLYV